jgi:CRP-like cAMP-binding protein
MSTADEQRRYEGGNVLLDGLPRPDRDAVVDALRVFVAEVPDCVVGRDEAFEDVYFPIDAIFSITAELRRGHVYEVGAVGRHGLIGAELALGLSTSPRSVMSQIGGMAARMPRDAFLRCYDASPAFARAVQRHLIHRLFLAEQLIACNFAHDVTQRCARWILMLRDQVGRHAFALRAEFLGMMLALPTPEAAAAGEALQRMGVLRYAREQLEILDAEALREVACECYEEQRRYAPQ